MSECILISIYLKTLLSQGNILFNDGLNQMFLLNCNKPVKLKASEREQEVVPGQLIVGDRFEIINNDESIVLLQGIAFIQQSEITEQEKLYITDIRDLPNIDELINLSPYASQLDISKAQLQLNQLWSSLIEKRPRNNLDKISPSILKGKIDKRLIIVHRYIRQHYGEPLTLQLLADLIHCNPVYLSNTYTKIFKITPMKHLQVMRMKKASELLKETSMSIKEIAVRLGYVSSSQFSLIFKRYFFCTPVEYRRNELFLNKKSGVMHEHKNE